MTQELLYYIDDIPKWYICILFGFQHYLAMLSGTIAYPTILASNLCLPEDSPNRGHLISTTFLVSGIGTLLQSTIGSRLPIIQGNSFSFLLPSLAILNLPQWKCQPRQNNNGSFILESYLNDSVINKVNYENDEFEVRMREIQGAIIGASIVEIILGVTGLVGCFIKYISPVAIAPIIGLIGLSLFKQAAGMANDNWMITFGTMALLVIFSQYLNRVEVPFCFYSSSQGWTKKGFPIFKLFPVILALVISWIVCFALTETSVFSEDNSARTDRSNSILDRSPWVRVPYPGQWGWPTFSLGALCGMLCGLVTSVIESVGDYNACAKLAGAPPPPTHAINRGIAIEGIGCLVAGLFGSGSALTSFSGNIAAIGVTKVASRRVIQWAGLILIVLSIFSKFGSLFIIIPGPILAGLFLFIFSMVSGVGLSTLQFVDLNSTRNVFIIGTSLFLGLMIPHWISSKLDAINTGYQFLDHLMTILLSTGIFVGGVVGVFLDNTIGGTDQERGILKWKQDLSNQIPSNDSSDDIRGKLLKKCYDLPTFEKASLKKFPFISKIPITQTYESS